MKKTKLLFKNLFDNKDILDAHGKLLKSKKTAKKLATRQKVVKAIAIAMISSSVACTGTQSIFGTPDLQLVASEEGVQAFFDGVIGNAMAGKHIENLPESTPYHQQRLVQEGGRTQRYLGWKANNTKNIK